MNRGNALCATPATKTAFHSRTGTWLPLVSAAALLAAGCASNDGYRQAFSEKGVIQGSNHAVSADETPTLRAAKMTLVHQGFAIENVDFKAGIIKATRNFPDDGNKNISYNIVATVDVAPNGRGTSLVTLAATQQTVLHRERYDWWHLLWVLPLFPVDTEYQTVVTREGNVTDPVFYSDFFAAVDKSLTNVLAIMTEAPASAPVAVSSVLPLPQAIGSDAGSHASVDAGTQAIPFAATATAH
jgi:hypothetical protein